jgi:hypothetical protein
MDSNTHCQCLDPFVTTKDSGEGEGLTEVFGIVRSNGGDLSVRSDRGRGEIFTIYLLSLERRVDSRPYPSLAKNPRYAQNPGGPGHFECYRLSDR